jgi:hypothetical protein
MISRSMDCPQIHMLFVTLPNSHLGSNGDPDYGPMYVRAIYDFGPRSSHQLLVESIPVYYYDEMHPDHPDPAYGIGGRSAQ